MKPYGLIFKFDDQSESFTNGVEFEMYYGKMERGEQIIEGNFHTPNEGMLRRAAEMFGYTIMVKDYGEELSEWKFITAIKNYCTNN